MRFPVRGEKSLQGSPRGQQLKMWGPWGGPERPKANADPRSDAGERR